MGEGCHVWLGFDSLEGQGGSSANPRLSQVGATGPFPAGEAEVPRAVPEDEGRAEVSLLPRTSGTERVTPVPSGVSGKARSLRYCSHIQACLGCPASIYITWVVQKKLKTLIWTQDVMSWQCPRLSGRSKSNYPWEKDAFAEIFQRSFTSRSSRIRAASPQHRPIDIRYLRTRPAWKHLQGTESYKSDPADLRKIELLKITNHNKKIIWTSETDVMGLSKQSANQQINQEELSGMQHRGTEGKWRREVKRPRRERRGGNSVLWREDDREIPDL